MRFTTQSARGSRPNQAGIASRLGITAPPFRIDSQCKYAVVARGEASIYLRLPRDTSYREKVWDHAAGSLVLEEAGGRVSDLDGRPLPGITASIGVTEYKPGDSLETMIAAADVVLPGDVMKALYKVSRKIPYPMG